tara:strand:- start:7787 stop:8005 length:219 start_codon:yes stop_codon:yes gene_type:complete
MIEIWALYKSKDNTRQVFVNAIVIMERTNKKVVTFVDFSELPIDRQFHGLVEDEFIEKFDKVEDRYDNNELK